MRKAKGDIKKIEMEKEEEENEGGGAETTMETEVQTAVAAEMGKVHAAMEKMGNVMAGQIKDGMEHMLKELRSSLSAEMGRELDKRDQQMEQRFGRRGGASEAEAGRPSTTPSCDHRRCVSS